MNCLMGCYQGDHELLPNSSNNEWPLQLVSIMMMCVGLICAMMILSLALAPQSWCQKNQEDAKKKESTWLFDKLSVAS